MLAKHVYDAEVWVIDALIQTALDDAKAYPTEPFLKMVGTCFGILVCLLMLGVFRKSESSQASP